VVPGDPASSYLVQKMADADGIADDRMPPPDEPPATEEEIALVEAWIRGGALP
jgi:hypothetical protein